MPEMKRTLFRVSFPWWLTQGGMRKYVADRLLHMPERYVRGWCEFLGEIGIHMTPEQWRGVEANLVRLLYDGIVITEYPT